MNLYDFVYSIVSNTALESSVINGLQCLFEEIVNPPKSIESWLSDSVVKIPVYHATGRSFDKFDPDKTNPESYFGRGIYFSSSTEDVKTNYASKKGKDVAGRIDNIIDALTQPDFGDVDETIEFLKEYLALEHPNYSDDEVDSAIEKIASKYSKGMPKQTASKIANRIYAKAFRTIPSFIRLVNPLIVTKDGEFFDAKMYDEPDYLPNDEDELEKMRGDGYDDYDEYYRDKQDEHYSNAEPSGKLYEFIEAMKYVASDYDSKAVDNCMSNVFDRFDGGAPAIDVLMYVKENLWTDSDPVNDLINQAIRYMGYDGIIMGPDPKWKMKIPYGTQHYIVFDPKNIRSAITGGEI